MKPRVLIAGASIAGPCVAFWLARAGYEVNIVELAPSLRPGGNGVDVREQAVFVAERMGLLGHIQEAATDMVGMRFVDARDRQLAGIDMLAAQRGTGTKDVEIGRGDLAQILFEATRNDVEYIFGDSIRSIAEDAAGVDVGFEHGPARRFDLVIGADGMHSGVRRLAFGPESSFVRFKQHYFAVATADIGVGEKRWITFYNTPGKSIGIYRPANRPAQVYVAFRSEEPLSYDYRDVAGQRRLVREAYAGIGWHARALLDAVDGAPDFYFDALSQVQMPTWSKGRIALVGDAAYCASPASGAGALLSLIGAYRLAGELVAAGGDHNLGFERYEAAHRPLVAAKQAKLFTGISVPKTRLGIWVRNAVVGSPLLSLLTGLAPNQPEPLPSYDFAAAGVT